MNLLETTTLELPTAALSELITLANRKRQRALELAAKAIADGEPARCDHHVKRAAMWTTCATAAAKAVRSSNAKEAGDDVHED